MGVRSDPFPEQTNHSERNISYPPPPRVNHFSKILAEGFLLDFVTSLAGSSPESTRCFADKFGGCRLCPSGSILLSTHYDPLSSHPTARRVLVRIFPEWPASTESYRPGQSIGWTAPSSLVISSASFSGKAVPSLWVQTRIA